MQTHSLLFTDHNGESDGIVAVVGQCSCSAWFDLRMTDRAELVVSARHNNWPPCPAVQGLVDHFEEELADAAQA